MALQVKETTFTGGGSSSRSADGSRKAKRTFIVVYDADTPPASLAAVETADDGTTAIPAEGSGLASDPNRTVQNVSVKPKDQTGLVFDVDVEYDNGEENAVVGGENPLTFFDTTTWDFIEETQTYFVDNTLPPDGPWIVSSSAGEPFENLLDRGTTSVVARVKQYIANSAAQANAPNRYFDPARIVEYARPNALNDAAMTIDGITFGVGQVRFVGAEVSEPKEWRDPTDPQAAPILYREQTLKLAVAPTWMHAVMDRGFHEKDPANPGKMKLINKNTPPVKLDFPWPLDGEGAALANAEDTPAVIYFKPYPLKPFNVWF